jgi:hypothetical protein
MIAMPCPPHVLQYRRQHAKEEERELAEYQIGVLEMPWDDDDDGDGGEEG